MKKPRNKTSKKRLHYLGVMAAAGIITTGAVPGLAADQIIDPSVNSSFSGSTGDTTIEGTNDGTPGATANVIWADTDIDGNLTFGNMSDGADAVGIDLTVGADGVVNGTIANTGNNAGAKITLSGTTGLQANGLSGGVNGISIVNDSSVAATVNGDVNGYVSLSGSGAYQLDSIGGTSNVDLNLGNNAEVNANSIGNVGTLATVNITSGLFGQDTAPAVAGSVKLNLKGVGSQTAKLGQINSGATLTLVGGNLDGVVEIGEIQGGNSGNATTIEIEDQVNVEFGSSANKNISGEVGIGFYQGVGGVDVSKTFEAGDLQQGAVLSVSGDNTLGALKLASIIGGATAATKTTLNLNSKVGVIVDAAGNDVKGYLDINFNDGSGDAQALALGAIGDASAGANLTVGGSNTNSGVLTTGNIDSTNGVEINLNDYASLQQDIGANITGAGQASFNIGANASATVGDVDADILTVDGGGDLTAGDITGSTVNAKSTGQLTVDNIDGATINVDADGNFSQSNGSTVTGAAAISNSSAAANSGSFGKIIGSSSVITVDSKSAGATQFAGLDDGTIAGSGVGSDTVNIGNIGNADAAANTVNIGAAGKGLEVVAAGTISGGVAAGEETTVNVADGSTLSGAADVEGFVDFNVDGSGSATVGNLNNATSNIEGELTAGNITDSKLTIASGHTAVGSLSGSSVSATGGSFGMDNIVNGELNISAGATMSQSAGKTVSGATSISNSNAAANSGSFGKIIGSSSVITVDSKSVGATQFAGLDDGTIAGSGVGSDTVNINNIGNADAAANTVNIGAAGKELEVVAAGTISGGVAAGEETTVNVAGGSTLSGAAADVAGFVDFNVDGSGSATVGDFNNATSNIAGEVTGGNLSGSSLNIASGNFTGGNLDGSSLTIASGATAAQTVGSAITGNSAITNNNADTIGSASLGVIEGGTVTVGSAPTGTVTGGTVFAGLESGSVKGALNGGADVVTVSGDFGSGAVGSGVTNIVIGGSNADEAVAVYGVAGQTVIGGVAAADKTVVTVNAGSILEGGGTNGVDGSGLGVTGHVDFKVNESSGTYAKVHDIVDATVKFSGDFTFTGKKENSSVTVLTDSNILDENDIVNGNDIIIESDATYKQVADASNPGGGPGSLTVSGNVGISNENTAAGSGSFGTIVKDPVNGTVITVDSKSAGATQFAGLDDGTIAGSGVGSDTVNIGNIGNADAAANTVNIGAAGKGLEVVAAGTISGGVAAGEETTVNVADGSTLSGAADVEGFVDFNVDGSGSATVGNLNNATSNIEGELTAGNITDSKLTIASGHTAVGSLSGSSVSATGGSFGMDNIVNGELNISAGATMSQSAGKTVSGATSISNSNAVANSGSFGKIIGSSSVITVDSKSAGATQFAGLDDGTIAGSGVGNDTVNINNIGNADAAANTVNIGAAGKGIEVVAAGTISGGVAAGEETTVNVADGSTLSGAAADVAGFVDFNVDGSGSATVGDFNNATSNIAGEVTGGNLSGSSLNIASGNFTGGNLDGSSLTIASGATAAQTVGSAITGNSAITNNNADTIGSASLGVIEGGTVTVGSAPTGTVTGGTVFAGLESGSVKGALNGGADVVTVSGDFGSGAVGSGVTNIVIGGSNADEAVAVYGVAGQTVIGGVAAADKTVVTVNAGSILEGGGTNGVDGSGLGVTGHVDFKVNESSGTYAKVHDIVDATVKFSGDFTFTGKKENSSVTVLTDSNILDENDIVNGNDIIIESDATYKQVADASNPGGGPGSLTVSGNVGISNENTAAGSGSFGTIVKDPVNGTVITVDSKSAGATQFAGLDDGTIAGSGVGSDTVNIGNIGNADAAANTVNIGAAGKGLEVVAAGTISGGVAAGEETTVNVADGSTLSGAADVEGFVDFNVDGSGSATVGNLNNATSNIEGELTAGNITDSKLTIASGHTAVGSLSGSSVSATGGSFGMDNIVNGELNISAGATMSQSAGKTVSGATSISNSNAAANSGSFGKIIGSSSVITVDSKSAGATQFAGLDDGTIAGSGVGNDTVNINNIGNADAAANTVNIGAAGKELEVVAAGTISGGVAAGEETTVNVAGGSTLSGAAADVAGFVDFNVDGSGSATVGDFNNATSNIAGEVTGGNINNSNLTVASGGGFTQASGSGLTGNNTIINNNANVIGSVELGAIEGGTVTVGSVTEGTTFAAIESGVIRGAANSGSDVATVAGSIGSGAAGSGITNVVIGGAAADQAITVSGEAGQYVYGGTAAADKTVVTVNAGSKLEGGGDGSVGGGMIATGHVDFIVAEATGTYAKINEIENATIQFSGDFIYNYIDSNSTVTALSGSNILTDANITGGTININAGGTHKQVADLSNPSGGPGMLTVSGDVEINNSSTIAGSGSFGTITDPGSVITVDSKTAGATQFAGINDGTIAGSGIGSNTVNINNIGNADAAANTVNIGAAGKGIEVVADGTISGGVAAGEKTTVNVAGGSTLSGATADVEGFVDFNVDPDGSATVGNLNTATLNVDGKITLGGTVGTSVNSITGQGSGGSQVYMQSGGGGFGNGGIVSLENTELVLNGTGNNIDKLSELHLDSTGGKTVLNAADGVSPGTIAMSGIHIDAIGNNNVEIKAKDMELQDALVINSGVFQGNGHLLVDASAAGIGDKGINLSGGVNVNAGNTGAVDFKGDVQIAGLVGANSLDVAEVSVNDGNFKVGGQTLQLNSDSVVNTGGKVDFDFSTAQNGQGFSQVNEFNTGVAQAKVNTITLLDSEGMALEADIYSTVSFQTGSHISTNKLNVTQGTIFNAPVTVTASLPTTGTGIYTSNGVNIEGQMVMQSELKIENGINGPGLVYNVDSSGNGPTVVLSNGSAGSSIAQGTKFEINGLASTNALVKLQTVSLDKDFANDAALKETQKEMWAALDYDGTIWNGNGSAQTYDKSSGTFTQVGAGRVDSAINGAPKWGKAYVTALMSYNPEIADYYGNNPDKNQANRDMVQAMGNTLNAAIMASSDNSLNPAFNHLNSNRSAREDHIVASSAGGEAGANGVWASPNVNHMTVDDDYSNGYGGFTVRNYSLALGYDRWLDNQVRLGSFLNFGNGKLDGNYQDVDSNSVQLGFYGQAELPESVNLNFGMGYSWQDYDATRDVFVGGVPAADQRIKSDFDANTLTIAAEVNRTIALEEYNMYLRPSVGYTYMNTEMDAYKEKSSLAHTNSNNLAQKVKGSSYDTHMFRVGTDIGTTGNDWSLVGRAYYVGNAGDTQAVTKATLSGAHVIAGADARSFNVRSAESDRHMFNPGVSVKVAPNECTSVVLDYDALLGSNTESHNVNMTIRYDF